jgi:hypothetical protein
MDGEQIMLRILYLFNFNCNTAPLDITVAFRRQLIPIFLLALTACSPQATPGKPSITNISLQTPRTLMSNEQVSLSALVQGTGTFDKAVTWTVTGGGNFADANTNPVIYTAPNVQAETVVTFRATSVGDPTKFATAEVTVEPLEPLETAVVPDVAPSQLSVPDGEGNSLPVAASRDERGVQSDFVVGQVLLTPTSEAELTEFIELYDGTILRDNTVPEPPARLGITLTPEQRAATEYLVRINLSRVDLEGFAADATTVGMGGLLELSSQDGLLTLAATTDALAAGFDVSPDYISYPDQTFPTALFRTEERSSGGSFSDAFATTRFQSSGSQANVTLAWQFVMAHGIARRVQIAVIDGGFWLNTNGTSRGSDSDFPANPAQYDFQGNDYFADGPNTTGCGAGNPCFWHGTGSTGVATGIVNNRLGDAGTGGLIADPILLKATGQRSQINWAIRTAIAWGADVISMSFGADCDSVACRTYDRDHAPFDDAVNGGSRTVFVAAAGNGEDPDGDTNFTGYNTGDPRFVHPCIEDHVICVGALNNDATSKIGYSNFGRVSIFAPTNIPVMSQPASNDPNPNGPVAPRSFGGTSASTPFVAGVAAMMKAVNPNLSSDQVGQILRDTAHRGPAPADFYIDAYAAVRRVAEGIDGVKDRFEPNAITIPTQLTGSGPWNKLNLHSAQDRDYYRFESAGRNTVRFDLSYPEPLGAVPWLGVDGSGACGLPIQVLDQTLPGGGRRLEYIIAAGPYTLGLGGGLLSAYNLDISFSTAPGLTRDIYEPNDEPRTARYLYSLKPRNSNFAQINAIDPAVTVDANLHSSGDIDYFQVRGVTTTVAQQVLFNGGPIVEVYGNESSVTLEVYDLNSDNTPGNLVQRVSSPKCGGNSLAVRVESGKNYLVKVTGAAGNYTLFNGVRADPRRLPEWVRDRLYLVLNPGDPIEHLIRTPLIYILTGDPAFSEINVRGKVHLELYDAERRLLAEGMPSGQGFDERLGFEGVSRGGFYALQITPTEPAESGSLMTLSWGQAPPRRISENLIRNPGAEEGPGNDSGGAVDFIDSWNVSRDGIRQPTVAYYNGVNGLPSADDAGPGERGDRFFAGGLSTPVSAIRQQSDTPGDFQAAVDAGVVKFDLSGYLGGFASQTDYATLSVSFVDANFQELGKVILGPITPGEREGKTGLYPVAMSDYVPAGTRYFYTDLEFGGADREYNDGYADNLELTFSDYTP